MNLHDEFGVIQHCINNMQSLIGYGTASEPKNSGEVLAMQVVSEKYPEAVVFDVGAHEGEYVTLMRERFPNMQYHCFEPERNSLRKLRMNLETRFGADHGIIVNDCAISHSDDMATIYTHIPGAAQASLVKLELEHLGVAFELEQACQTKTLETYMKETGLKQIDFLKMDIEGWEFNVLNSAMNLCSTKRIKYIQFEYGAANIDSRTFLKDFYKLLRPHYNFYRIHPRGLYACNDYREEFECFNLCNYFLELYN